ncbi:MAG: NADH-quinone oxidoreductase subunit N [Deltaproteobacteria bacterium]|nr:NADH-quinone oxidoreductase subunit N [Deltaproteobacteria bacterium]
MTVTINDVVVILPFLVASGGALLIILLDSFSAPRTPRRFLGGFTIFFLAVAALSAYIVPLRTESAFHGMVMMDGLARFLSVVVMLSAGFATLLAMDRLPEQGSARGEFYALLLFSAAGASLLASAADLVMVFLGLETLSIPAYAMAAALRRDVRSTEAGFKYFVLGAFATGFFLMGTALVYSSVGSTALGRLAAASASGWTEKPLLCMGAVMLLVGLAFKAAVVPFHMWAPDVYDGSPTPATAYFATGIKAAAFAALLRVVILSLPGMRAEEINGNEIGWHYIFWGLAAATMAVSSLTALVQKDVKRILAYSSVAHVGYLLIGLLAGKPGGAAVLFYLLVYTFMTVGAFAVVAYLENSKGGTKLSDYAGIAKRHPYAAAAMAVFLFSLAGIPPTGGFFAKFYLFKAAVQGGLINLTVLGVLFSVVSAYYYLRIVVAMYMEQGENQAVIDISPSAAVVTAICLCLLFTIIIGLYPTPYLSVAQASASMLP